jgi:dihydroorotate dehydrogenase
MYQIIKKILFQIDAENAHHTTIRFLQLFGKHPQLLNVFLGYPTRHEKLHREVFGLHFSNPVGLAAGLDKNAEVIDQMAAIGFGFVEIGTITPLPQPGNEKPRLFRLLKDEALINRMGFNNVGADLAAARLSRRKSHIVVGANIGKNKSTDNESAFRDYEYCFNTLFDVADYFVVNVSSPNTPGLRELQEKKWLGKILSSLQNINSGKPTPKPLLLKISPDLSESQIKEIAEVAKSTQINGIVATNTTVTRTALSSPSETIEQMGTGGLSGKPLKHLSTSVIQSLVEALQQIDYNIPIVGVGGIMSAGDAMEKFKAGASLIQLYTGFVYHGPRLIKEINDLLISHEINSFNQSFETT